MSDKPRTRAGYTAAQAQSVREACLYLATKLGDLFDDIVVIGGLVPSLIVPAHEGDAHVGTADLDLGLSLAVFAAERYAELAARLRTAGLSPDLNEEGNLTRQRWRIDTLPVTVDFLIPPTGNEQPGTVKSLTKDFAAIIAPGLRLAFEDRQRVELRGRTTRGEQTERSIWVCGPAAFVLMKALALRARGENKDAYDLVYVLRGLGASSVADRLRPLLEHASAQEAVEILRADFATMEHVGPRRASEFLHGDTLDDSSIAEAWSAVQDLLEALG